MFVITSITFNPKILLTYRQTLIPVYTSFRLKLNCKLQLSIKLICKKESRLLTKLYIYIFLLKHYFNTLNLNLNCKSCKYRNKSFKP